MHVRSLTVLQAKNLRLCITAGVGSDHVDLNAAVDKRIQVLEVSGSNVVSVAEHVIMSILLLVRNFVPAHEVRYLLFSYQRSTDMYLRR